MQALGFGQYESKVYLALLQQGNVSGYELAKNSGVPASKIYAILNKLVARELVQIIDTEPKKYIPQPPQEILSRMKGDFLQTVDALQDKLEQIYVQEAMANDHIFNLSGRDLIIRKVQDFIHDVEKSIWLSIWDEEVDEIAADLKAAATKKVTIRIVHFGQKMLNIGQEYRHGREHQIRVQRGGRRIALICDDSRVILGHFQEDGSSNAAWTTNKGLVLLAKDYVIHDIYTIRIAEKFGADADEIFQIS